MIILPCMKRPDLDAVGGSLAYAEYLQRKENKKVKVWISDIPDGEARFYLDKFQVNDLASIEEVKQAKEFQLVDLSRAEALPDFIDLSHVTKVIDHRFLHDTKNNFPHAVIELEAVGAAATQITEYFMRADLVPTAPSASMLYGAIYSNTLCLKGDITTQRDLDAAGWLQQKVPSCDRFTEYQLQARKQDIIDNLEESVGLERKTFQLSTGIYGFTQYEMIQAAEFWQENKTRIKTAINDQAERSLLSLIDLSKHVSILYVNDADLLQRLEHAFKQPVTDNTIILKPALMRKQIAKILEDKK